MQRVSDISILDPNIDILQASQFTLSLTDDGLVMLSVFDGPSIPLKPIKPAAIDWVIDNFETNSVSGQGKIVDLGVLIF